MRGEVGAQLLSGETEAQQGPRTAGCHKALTQKGTQNHPPRGEQSRGTRPGALGMVNWPFFPPREEEGFAGEASSLLKNVGSAFGWGK